MCGWAAGTQPKGALALPSLGWEGGNKNARPTPAPELINFINIINIVNIINIINIIMFLGVDL